MIACLRGGCIYLRISLALISSMPRPELCGLGALSVASYHAQGAVLFSVAVKISRIHLVWKDLVVNILYVLTD